MKKKKHLFLIVGPSGSGKDYMVDKACEDFCINKVISRTSRKPRYEGEDTHLFVSLGQALNEIDDSIAETYYHGNYYYTIKDDFTDSGFYIIDTKGVKSFKGNILDDFVIHTIYIKVPTIVRAYRMLKRGDSFKSMLSRLRTDRKEFKEAPQLCEYSVSNYDQLFNLLYYILFVEVK